MKDPETDPISKKIVLTLLILLVGVCVSLSLVLIPGAVLLLFR